MKRSISLFLSLALFLLLCACGNSATTWQEQYDLGLRYLSEGNYEEAIIAFTAAIEIDPKMAIAYEKLAEAYTESGDVTAAVTALAKGVEVTGDEALSALLTELAQQAGIDLDSLISSDNQGGNNQAAPLQPMDGYPKTETTALSNGGTMVTEYDQFGRPVASKTLNPDGSVQQEASYEYDQTTGKLLRRTHYQNGGEYNGFFDVATTEEYDSQQRLSAVTREWISLAPVASDPSSNNRTESSIYTYSSDGRTVEISTTLSSNGNSTSCSMTHKLSDEATYVAVMGLGFSWEGSSPVNLRIEFLMEYTGVDRPGEMLNFTTH